MQEIAVALIVHMLDNSHIVAMELVRADGPASVFSKSVVM